VLGKATYVNKTGVTSLSPLEKDPPGCFVEDPGHRAMYHPEMSEKPRAIQLIEDRWATVRHVVEAAALVAAGLWAFYTFIYQEKIKPAQEPASLNDTISVERLGHDAKRDVLEVSIHLRNDGKTEIEIAADGYNVWGDRYASRASQTSRDSAKEFAFSNDEQRVSRRLIRSFAELRDPAVGGKQGVHTTLEPGEIITIPYIIVIPRGVYDVISAQVIAVPVKSPVHPRVNVRVTRSPDGSLMFHTSSPGVFEDDNSVNFGLLQN
jgi:hypothetical protein